MILQITFIDSRSSESRPKGGAGVSNALPNLHLSGPALASAQRARRVNLVLAAVIDRGGPAALLRFRLSGGPATDGEAGSNTKIQSGGHSHALPSWNETRPNAPTVSGTVLGRVNHVRARTQTAGLPI